MLHLVSVESKQLDAYRDIVGDQVLEEIRRLAEPLRGARVVHVNATAYGGGVAEILQTLVPLMRDVGLDASWQVIEGADEFFNFVVVHDPQPAGLLHYTGGHQGKHWMWRCHIDTSHPNLAYWNFIAPYINEYPTAIFTMKEYVGPGVSFQHLAIIPPTIDPLSPKNAPIPREEARAIVARYGFDLDRPLLLQVSRFDPWKDPLGVIDCYRLVKQHVPNVQLALVGAMASDDPEGWDYYDRTLRHAGEDFDIRILHNFHGVGHREVNAFQRVADVVIQKSTREGFGLVVTEAMWKGKPVVGGKVGGIPLQIVDGETGFLVSSVEECADRVLYLLQHPEDARRMGDAARERVRQHFLCTRHLLDYLKLFNEVSGQ